MNELTAGCLYRAMPKQTLQYNCTKNTESELKDTWPISFLYNFVQYQGLLFENVSSKEDMFKNDDDNDGNDFMSTIHTYIKWYCQTVQ